MNKLKLLLLNLLNLSPIFSISSDELFGAIDNNYAKRYSLVRVTIGFIKIYFFSFRNGHFDIIKKLDLNKLRPWPSVEITEEKVKAYEEFIVDKSKDEMSIQIQYLENKIDIENFTKTSFQNKVSIYNAILLLTAGYIFYLFKEMLSKWQPNMQCLIISFILFIILMNFFNCIVFLYNFSKNKTIFRSTFGEIKKTSTQVKYATSSYFDWFNLKEERDVLSTYVQNIEKYIVKTIVLVFLLSVVQISFDTFLTHSDAYSKNKYSINDSLTFIDIHGKFNNEKLQLLPSILNDMFSNDLKKIYIVKTKLIKNKIKCEQVLSSLQLFSENIDIQEVEISDNPANQEIFVIKPVK